ncbi:MAG: hypothetical protein NVS3B16_06540 [Vulcanimicrobiaceae bacterium]
MAIAYRLLGDRATAEDLTQQTFLRLWDRAATMDAREGRLRPWLLSVARHAAIDDGRRRRTGASAVERVRAAQRDERDVADTVVDRAQSHATRDLLLSLNADQRTVVELAYFGGLTQMEISAMLDVPLGTVKSRLRLALQHLRARVTHNESGLG